MCEIEKFEEPKTEFKSLFERNKKIINLFKDIENEILNETITVDKERDTYFFNDLYPTIKSLDKNNLEKIKNYIYKNRYSLSLYGSSNRVEKEVNIDLQVSKNNKFIILSAYDEDIKGKSQKFIRLFFVSSVFNKEHINETNIEDIEKLYFNVTCDTSLINRKNDISIDDYHKGVNSSNNYVSFNKYKYLGRTQYNKELQKTVEKLYKNKEGENIPLKTGLLFKCDECNKYEPVDNADLLCCYTFAYSRFDEAIKINSKYLEYYSITCGNCKKVLDVTENNLYDIRWKTSLNKFHEVFDIDTNKIILASVCNSVKGYWDTYSCKNISKKIVFNLDTGKTYLLPNYDIKKRKKLSSIQQMSGSYCNNFANFHISFNEFMKIGLNMEKYIRKNDENGKYIIPFVDYITSKDNRINFGLKISVYNEKEKDFILASRGEILDYILNYEEEPNELYNTKLNTNITYELVNILIMYNQNPYISHNKFSALSSLFNANNYISKIIVRNVSKIRNINIEQQSFKKIGIKTKSEKKSMSRLLYSNKDMSVIFVAKNILRKFNNKDNKNKMLSFLINIAENNGFYYNSQVFIFNNQYMDDLIKKHGETAFVNAISKIENNRSNNFYLYSDTINNYEKIKKFIPEYELPSKRLRLKDLHDKISKDATKLRQPLVNYGYDEKFLERFDNKVIDDVTFEVAKSNHKLTEIGSQMNICVGGYNNYVEAGDLFIVSMKKDNEYVGCLEIQIDSKIYQAKYKRNDLIANHEDLYDAFKIYTKIANLGFTSRDVKREDQNNTEFLKPIKELNKYKKLKIKLSSPKLKIIDNEIFYDDNEIVEPNEDLLEEAYFPF